VRQQIILATLLTALAASAQDDQHRVPAPAVDSSLPYTTVLTPPMPVSSLRMPLTFSSETGRSNYVRGSLRVGSGYDDNVMATPSHHVSDVSYMILPSIDIGQTRERWNWDFGYTPGFTVNQRVVERNQAAHDLHMLFDYRLSPHVTARIHESFQKTNSLFSDVMSSPSVGPLQEPNTSGITPLANRTGNTSGLDLTYQFGAGSLVGASGNFYFVNYDAPSTSTIVSYLIDTRSWGGNAFYAHRFSERHWAGFTYNFQRLLFDPGFRTDVNRTLFFYSLSAGSHVAFSVWAGPEGTSSVAPALGMPNIGSGSSQQHWSVAGGADLSWQGKGTSTRVGYTRQTSDGGGLAQAVTLQQVSGELRERFTAKWTGSASLGYARNNPLNALNGTAPYHSWMGSVGCDYSLTSNLAVSLSYGRDQLSYAYAGVPAVTSNRNRAFFSVSYSFSRPLGR
jgi:hypothetical protein